MHLENEFEPVHKKDQVSVTEKKNEAYSKVSLPEKGTAPLGCKHFRVRFGLLFLTLPPSLTGVLFVFVRCG